MTKYAGEVTTLFSNLEVPQLSSYIKTLGINDVKVLHAEVLPQIKDLERRKQIKQLLTEREQQLFASGKEQVLANALRETTTITERLEAAYAALTKEALSGLLKDETRKLVLALATADEFELLEEKIKSLNDPQFAAIQLAIEEKKKKRPPEPEKPATDMGEYQKWWQKKHARLQWENKHWENLVKNTNQANLELNKRPEEKPLETAARPKPGFFARAGEWIKNKTLAVLDWALLTPFRSLAQTISYAWNKITPKRGDRGTWAWVGLNALTLVGAVIIGGIASIGAIPYNYFVAPIVNYAKKFPPKPEPYKLEISEEENALITQMRRDGAQDIINKTAMTKVGSAGPRKPEQIETAMMARFGMVLASQMIAGTQGEPGKHGTIGSVIGSLTDPDDTHEDSEAIYEAVANILPEHPEPGDKNPLKKKNGEHAFDIGGEPEIVVAFESKVIDKLVKTPRAYEALGLKFTKEEHEQIKEYYNNHDRSSNLVHLIQDVTGDFGGYRRKENEEGYEAIPDEALRNKRQAEFEKKLNVAGKAFQKDCLDLKDGEALYLETGLEMHAMQLVIRRIGNEYKISTYDSSGALENTSNKQSILGFLKIGGMDRSAQRKNALSFNVSADKLNSKEGLEYLKGLVRSKSLCGWAESTIKLESSHISREERAHMSGITGQIEEWLSLNERSNHY